LKGHAARQQRDLARRHVQHAQLGGDRQRALLRHDQHLAVGVDEGALHAAVGQHQVRGDAGLRIGVAVDHDGVQAVDEVQRPVGRHRRRRASAAGWAACPRPSRHRSSRSRAATARRPCR
jgi:hypothetical protein